VVEAAVCYAKYMESGVEAASAWLSQCEARRATLEDAAAEERRKADSAKCAQRGLVTEVEGVKLHLAPGTKTGYAGVWLAGRGRSGYRAELEKNGSRRVLGRFENVLDAALAVARYIQKLEKTDGAAPPVASGKGAHAEVGTKRQRERAAGGEEQ